MQFEWHLVDVIGVDADEGVVPLVLVVVAVAVVVVDEVLCGNGGNLSC